MLAGRSFRLRVSTLALVDEKTRRRSIIVPAGSIVKVISHQADYPNSLVEAVVEGRTIEMFAADIRTRGDEVF